MEFCVILGGYDKGFYGNIKFTMKLYINREEIEGDSGGLMED